MQAARVAAVVSDAEAMPLPGTFPFRDGRNGKNDDGPFTALELEPSFTTQDEEKELATLSIADIVNVESDLRGITSGISGLSVGDRTDGMDSPQVTAILSRLEEEMSELPVQQAAAYRRALAECPDQVSDDRKKAFLEHENGDALLTARRLAKYWEYRLDLFGFERCFLPMTLAGAMKDEVEPMVHRRIWQLMPVTDTAGRAVVFFCPSRRKFSEYSIAKEYRAFFYLLETIIQDADLRRRGVIVLYDGRNIERKHYSRKIKRFAATIESALPIRFRAFQVCYPSKVFYYLTQPVFKHFLSKDWRMRIKVHYGSTAEVLRDLEGYCLPRDRLPTELGGDILLNMDEWVMERKAFEISRTDMKISKSAADGPATKRLRSNQGQEILVPAAPVIVPLAASNNKKHGNCKSRSKGKVGGKKSDPRMTRAIEAKKKDANLSLYDALIAGGFVFREDRRLNEFVDADGITLTQRKNNLCRRIRIERQKQAEQGFDGSADASKAESKDTKEKDGMASSMPVSTSVPSQVQEEDCDAAVDGTQQSAPSFSGNSVAKPATCTMNGAAKRDSFYESIRDLPGIDDMDHIDFFDIL